MSLGQTRPSRPAHSTEPPPPDKRSNWTLVFFSLLLFGGALLLLGTASGWLGFKLGERQFSSAATQTMDVYLAAQFEQAVNDVTAGNYELARERLQYILTENPNFTSALDLLVDVEVVLGASNVPTVKPPTATPSPTPDLRPVEQQYDSVRQMISLGEWQQALDMLANLRKTNPEYKIVEVDGLIYVALRNRGIQKILGGDLESGIYDFTLAEQFGPLDGETENYRNWARLYLLGNAFWGAYPEQAAYYYGQLVSAAPGITDSSGVSAFYRYWASLLQIGDELAEKEEWCAASGQMVTVLGVWDQNYVYPTATWVFNQCLKLTPSVTPTATITPTIDPTLLVTPTFTLSPTTETPAGTTVTPSNTPVTPAGTTVTPSETPVPPTESPSATPTDIPSATPEP